MAIKTKTEFRPPKIGDTVNYIIPRSHPWPRELQGQPQPAKVTFVHFKHEGRLVNLDLPTEKGIVAINYVPFAPADNETEGDWHWGAEAPPAKKENP
jgi:hypothetical protein